MSAEQVQGVRLRLTNAPLYGGGRIPNPDGDIVVQFNIAHLDADRFVKALNARGMVWLPILCFHRMSKLTLWLHGLQTVVKEKPKKHISLARSLLPGSYDTDIQPKSSFEVRLS